MADAAQATRDRAIDALRAMADAMPGATVGRRARRGLAGGTRASRRGARRGLGGALRTNMTPMIDVVFQLLVFFIATTRYASDERVISMELARRAAQAPATAQAGDVSPVPAPQDPFVLDDESLRLEVAADGTVTAGAPLRRAFRAEELRASLAAEIRLPGRAGGMFEPAFPIVIAPAENAPWEAAVETLDAAVAAGFRNVGFERRPGSAGAGRR
jgi:biopolymer transport protein ExbD